MLCERAALPETSPAVSITSNDDLVDLLPPIAPSEKLILVRSDDQGRALVEFNERTKESTPLANVRIKSSVGEGISSLSDGWCYSTAGAYEDSWGAVFVTSSRDSSPAVRFVPLPFEGRRSIWL